MSLPAEATTEQIEATRAWIRDFYKGIESSDLNSWVTQFFQSDATFKFGESPPVKGHKEIADSFEEKRADLWRTKHNILHVDVFSDRIYVQKKDTFIVNNDSEQKEIIIKVLAVIWKTVDEDKLSTIDVYLDPTPLLDRIKICSK